MRNLDWIECMGLLDHYRACDAARDWARRQSSLDLRGLIQACPQPDWLMWAAEILWVNRNIERPTVDLMRVLYNEYGMEVRFIIQHHETDVKTLKKMDDLRARYLPRMRKLLLVLIEEDNREEHQ